MDTLLTIYDGVKLNGYYWECYIWRNYSTNKKHTVKIKNEMTVIIYT